MISNRSRSLPLALTLVLLAVSPVFGIFDCCSEYTDKKFKASQVGMFERYYHQDSAGVCDIDAIVFIVNFRPCGEKPKKFSFCADPEQEWVKNMISAMKKQTNKSKKRHQRKQQKRCKHMKKNKV